MNTAIEITEELDVGSMPDRFYKYRSMSGEAGQRVLKSILDSEVYFPSPFDFNDIFDCRPVFTCTGSDDELIRHYIRVCRARGRYEPYERLVIEARGAIGDPFRDPRIRQVSVKMQREMATILARAGVYCVSEKRDDLLMWAHYADNHRGICLEFDSESELMHEALRVIYTDRRPTIDQLQPANTHDKMEKALLTKSNHWSYEAEWRIVHQVLGVGTVAFDPSALIGVVFGAAVLPDVEAQVRDAIAKSKSSGVKYYRSTADDLHFKLNIEQIS